MNFLKRKQQRLFTIEEFTDIATHITINRAENFIKFLKGHIELTDEQETKIFISTCIYNIVFFEGLLEKSYDLLIVMIIVEKVKKVVHYLKHQDSDDMTEFEKLYSDVNDDFFELTVSGKPSARDAFFINYFHNTFKGISIPLALKLDITQCVINWLDLRTVIDKFPIKINI